MRGAETQRTERVDNMGGLGSYIEPGHSEALILLLCKGCESECHQKHCDDLENPRKVISWKHPSRLHLLLQAGYGCQLILENFQIK